jgi:phosphomannomutase
MDELVFGTDGWRDIIGDRFTLVNVGRVAQGYANHLIEAGASSAIVAHDTRFNGQMFSLRVAEVLASNGLEVLISDGPIPTPVLSFAVAHLGAGGGVMLTASHNPPSYNGLKLKGAYGGTATEEIYQDVGRRITSCRPEDVHLDRIGANFERLEIRGAYFRHLSRLVDFNAISTLHGTVIHDAMGGAGGTWVAEFVDFLGLDNIRVLGRRSAPDPMFYGVNPEPLPANLAPLMTELSGSPRRNLIFATATDGDGDRLGVVLPGGMFFNSHQIFSVLIDLFARRGARGRVVKSYSVSRLVERLARARGFEVFETPVGFKYIVEAMLQGDVVVGGEESGGIGVAGHIPERDGIANSLLLLEAVGRAGVSLREIFESIEREVEWSHAYDRLDLHLEGNLVKKRVMSSLKTPPISFHGRAVTSVETFDGVKLNLVGGAWLLVRPSGTEAIVRIYCEAETQGEVEQILGEAERFIRHF